MLHKTIIIVTVTVLVAFAVSMGADVDSAKTKTTKELKPQTLCPVMGKPIDSTAYTDIQGQRVYHCCPMCSKKVKADPDFYFKKAAADGILFENIQTTCPVSGETLEDKDLYTDFEGRRIYFCCKKCEKSFASDPHKYLNKMDENSDERKEAEKGHMEGHKHGSGHGSH